MKDKEEILELLKENVRNELKLCQLKDIDEDKLEYAVRTSFCEHINAIVSCSVAEYYLLLADYYNAKKLHKKYCNVLRELL
jgi:hypothetical protein